MTKQEAIEVVREEIRRLRDIPMRTENPITAEAAVQCADKMQWVLDTLTDATD